MHTESRLGWSLGVLLGNGGGEVSRGGLDRGGKNQLNVLDFSRGGYKFMATCTKVVYKSAFYLFSVGTNVFP